MVPIKESLPENFFILDTSYFLGLEVGHSGNKIMMIEIKIQVAIIALYQFYIARQLP
jgi:hypothetical protein